MSDVFIVDALRTPWAAMGGALANWHAADLLAHVIKELVTRNSLSHSRISEVVTGCASPVGQQAANISRNAVLAAGLPETTPAHTVEGQELSSDFALRTGDALIRSGEADVVLVGGVCSSSQVPAGATLVPATGRPYGPEFFARFADGLPSVPDAIESFGRKRNLKRQTSDEWARVLRERAVVSDAIVPTPVKDARGLPSATACTLDEAASKVINEAAPPLFDPEGTLAVTNVAAPADGASVVLLASEGALQGLPAPRGRLLGCSVTGSSPVEPFDGVVAAVREAAGVAGTGTIGSYWFAAHAAMLSFGWMQDLAAAPDHVDPTGGSLATGSAPGADGLRNLADCVSCCESGTSALATPGSSGQVATTLYQPLSRGGGGTLA